MEGVKQFQDFIENESDQPEKEGGDFVIYDKLSDWRNWLHKKEVYVLLIMQSNKILLLGLNSGSFPNLRASSAQPDRRGAKESRAV